MGRIKIEDLPQETSLSRKDLARVFGGLYWDTPYFVGLLKKPHPPMFAKFAKKKPGLEHLAGVPKGGTLILVGKGGDGGADGK